MLLFRSLVRMSDMAAPLCPTDMEASPPDDGQAPENVQKLTESLERMPVLMQNFSTVLRSLYAENAFPENAKYREFLRLVMEYDRKD